MTKTYYVVSTNTAETVASKTKTVVLSENNPNETVEGAMPNYMGTMTVTIDDPAEINLYQVGAKITMTLTPEA